MAAGGGVSSAADKAAWWKQRVKLDQRMAALLQQMDARWLGPWRCLLVQPPAERGVEAAAAAAAVDFVAEFFDCVLGEWVMAMVLMAGALAAGLLPDGP